MMAKNVTQALGTSRGMAALVGVFPPRNLKYKRRFTDALAALASVSVGLAEPSPLGDTIQLL